MIMSVKRIFIAPDVLFSTTDPSSPWQNTAIKALQKARERGFEVIISQQVLREYLAINAQTTATDNNVLPQSSIEQVRAFQTSFTVIRETEDVLTTLINLLQGLLRQEIPVTGKHVDCANIIATMIVYNIEHLLTYEMNDYLCFSDKIHILPLEKWIM